jgi:hypothetical protein
LNLFYSLLDVTLPVVGLLVTVLTTFGAVGIGGGVFIFASYTLRHWSQHGVPSEAVRL